MQADKADIITRLKQELLTMQGFKPALGGNSLGIGLDQIEAAFPGSSFPQGAIHEFVCGASNDVAATTGFVSGILGSLMKHGGACLWIGSSTMLFPPALKFFNIEPDRIIFINLKKENDILWAMEEALKCEGLAAVIGEIPGISFTISRRLQLAVEQSRVTGFLLHRQPKKVNITACVSRWRIKPLPSESEDGLPGVGFPGWRVELLKVRNGKPGTWDIRWVAGRFKHIPAEKLTAVPLEILKKQIG